MYNESMLKENTFDNKVILITGGGTGLGKSMSSYLLSLGGKVIITSRKLDVLEATKKEFDKIYLEMNNNTNKEKKKKKKKKKVILIKS